MKLFRVHNTENFGGMWYNIDGTSNRLVEKLSDKRLAEMPMEADYKRYHDGGKQWQCAVGDIESFNMWFSKQDFRELIDMGCKAISFDTDEFILQENQILFTRETISNVTDITDYLFRVLK